ncbi:Predicted dehydrogenase [Actinopolymorpha cephalotaxi]|uniref:Dehydrogenase n=1 Tax=Actinopolymorpha cephalotaxi TaxID=504797 RepID=A0A1I2S104_9ACTN|nr:Gfo/Idh/MocA family oxidoreductase [Actinopolymorpha cephalotaxi]NYH83848.1 putative dehydrogenase [Actinopolymorpha cephalotaxi]SFG46003.1 Predicted dehydrogenase [Actinopolymorpha cephalotaxi]
MTSKPTLGVGMVGYAFMGQAHSQAWRTVNAAFDLPYAVDMAAIAGRSEDKVKAAAEKFGWRSYETDWRALVERDDIGLVDVCSPGGNHAEVAIAALAAGKHVLCEKPLANTVEEAREMVKAAEAAAQNGIRSMVGFNYRRVPAAAFARQLVLDGKLGAIRHVRAVYLQDWITDPEFPLVWRLKKEEAGSGALGDIASHIVDLTQFVTGQTVTGVSGLTETFVKERPLVASTEGLRGTGSSERGEVTVDDAALFIARLSGGAVATYEATRFATGRRNGLRIELNGEKGSLVFDLERLNELELYLSDDDAGTQGFRRILVTEPEHPYMSAWWPAGHIIGWEHSFTHEAYDLVTAIAAGTDPAPTFADGLQVQLVLDAVERSAESGSGWIPTTDNS